MRENMLLKKTCSIYTSDLHFVTKIFPFVHGELSNNATIKTILERNEQKNIEKVLESIGLNSEIKDKIRNIDWEEADINKIRENFKLLEKEIIGEKKIDIIVLGKNVFIKKVNEAIDIWAKNKLEILERSRAELNIINCFSFEENANLDTIFSTHDYILNTLGLEEILGKEELLKAN